MSFKIPRFTNVADVAQGLRGVVSVGNVIAGLLEDKLRKVPSAEFIDVTANATADTPFIVRHSLGTVPRFASAMSAADGYLYVTADDLAEWTATQIKVRHSVANATLVVKVEV